MRVLCSPNSFKGSLAAGTVAKALALGVRDAGGQPCLMPMADGGDGTLDVLLAAAAGAHTELVSVTGPSGRRILARLGWANARTAVVEMAEATGLRRVHGQLRPLAASSYGVGELMRKALDGGAEHLLVGVGGSASTDGGSGLMMALGARLLRLDGRDVGLGGGSLKALSRVDLSGLDSRLAKCQISVAVDVSTPLVGPAGAAVTFSPQKGATPIQVTQLAGCLVNWAYILERDALVPIALRTQAGGGAAGGAAYGLAAIGASLRPGAALVADAIGLDEAIAQSDLVITGEGCLDSQTEKGKAPMEVARRAAAGRIPCVAVAGRIEADLDIFTDVVSLDALAAAAESPLGTPRRLLRRAASLVVRRFIGLQGPS